MLRKTKSKKKEILSDKITSLLTVAPTADVEDDVVFGTKPKTVTREDLESDDDGEDATLSSFKKQNVALLADLSSKYAGVVSKRTLQTESDVDDDHSDADEVQNKSDSEEEEDSLSNKLDDSKSEDENPSDDSFEDEEHSQDEASEDGSDFEGSNEGFDLSQLDAEQNGEFTHMKETNVSDEISKGNCVRNQLLIWENLLEMRINLQKCLIGANKMPLYSDFKEFKKDEKFAPALGKTKGNVTMLLTKLLDLQTHLLSQYPETKNMLNENSKTPAAEDFNHLDEEIPSDSDVETNEPNIIEKPKANRKRKINNYVEDLAKRHTSYVAYRNSTIQKWNDKTKLAMSHQKNQSSTTSTLSQIDFILNDKNKLIRRTQQKRSKYEILGSKRDDVTLPTEKLKDHVTLDNDEEYCTEIFDDDDFYHQLLRELIEHKSADISDPIQLSRQWIALQQMRNKMKRKIDTRATKGRRIRYAVHTKLVNFMAPRKNTDWTEESKSELFASLFGKQYESQLENGK